MITNVTPRPGGSSSPANPKGRHLAIWALIVIVVILFLKACVFHENSYEKIAREMTAALQSNDQKTVLTFQNAETATHVTRGVVGRAADVLAPLGKLDSVKEVTPKDAAERVHDFDLSFAHGTLHEEIKFDPDNKVVAFHYDPPVKK